MSETSRDDKKKSKKITGYTTIEALNQFRDDVEKVLEVYKKHFDNERCVFLIQYVFIINN